MDCQYECSVCHNPCSGIWVDEDGSPLCFDCTFCDEDAMDMVIVTNKSQGYAELVCRNCDRYLGYIAKKSVCYSIDFNNGAVRSKDRWFLCTANSTAGTWKDFDDYMDMNRDTIGYARAKDAVDAAACNFCKEG